MNYSLHKDLIECGLDECARGCIFGRIYSACVIFPKDFNELDLQIKDSKKLSKKKRELVYEYIIKRAIDYSISWIDEKDIDEKGIQYCNMKVFHDCIDKLKVKPQFILIDGTQFKSYNNIPHLCIKKGDSKYYSIAAASILAKVAHDNYIKDLCNTDNTLCNYDLLNNMGYGTKNHINAIRKYGFCKYHRKSYKIKSL